jgi:hypothetical protein
VAVLAVEASLVEPIEVFSNGDLEVVDVKPGPRLRMSSALKSEFSASAMALS